jgi:hypothetical protein
MSMLPRIRLHAALLDLAPPTRYRSRERAPRDR